MAQFETNGLDALVLDMDEISSIDDNTMWEMLEAGAEVIKRAHREKLKELFTARSGKLMASPTVRRKIGSGSKYVLIYPSGEHHKYRARSSTYTKMNWGRAGKKKTKGGGSATATNQDVGFVHEFGGHGNSATQWMRTANEAHAGEAVDAEFAVFDNWHKSHNL